MYTYVEKGKQNNNNKNVVCSLINKTTMTLRNPIRKDMS
jgi:hypothetical protein